MSTTDWRGRLLDEMPPDLAEEIDIFEAQMLAQGQDRGEGLRRDAPAPRRLRPALRQRPAPRRHRRRRSSPSPRELTKGPETLGRAGHAAHQDPVRRPDAGSDGRAGRAGRGVLRRHPATSPRARTSSSTSSTSTTRPTSMRRLAAVGITTREACGNTVRNVTACPLAGVCHTEAFDVTPYAKATRSSCSATRTRRTSAASSRSPSPAARDEACGLVSMHDLGGIAADAVDGRQARLRALRRRRPRRRAAPGEAVRRVPARGGAAAAGPGHRRASSRGSARRRTATAPASSSSSRSWASRSSASSCSKSAQTMPDDPRWTAVPRRRSRSYDEKPAASRPCSSTARSRPEGFDAWRETNVYAQRQAGYAVATVTLPLGDITSDQMRAARPTSRARTRATPSAPRSSRTSCCAGSPRPICPTLYAELKAIGLGAARRRHDRRRHRLPGHRHLQARHRRPRAASPASCARAWRPSSSTLDEAVTRPAHQGVAAASTPAASTTSPTSASTATAATSAATPCPTSR